MSKRDEIGKVLCSQRVNCQHRHLVGRCLACEQSTDYILALLSDPDDRMVEAGEKEVKRWMACTTSHTDRQMVRDVIRAAMKAAGE